MSGHRGVERRDWAATEIATLTEMWRAGATAGAIASALQRTRSAVLGRARRLGLPGRASPIKKFPGAAPRPSRVAPRRPAGREVAQTSRPAVPPAAARPVGVALRNLRGSITRHTAPRGPRAQMIALGGAAYRTCRYPLWDDDLPRPPRPAPFCAAPVAALGCPWCATHFAIVFVCAQPAAPVAP